MAWLVSEQGVEARSGHGSVTFSVRERRQPTRAMPVNEVRLSPEALAKDAVAARWAATSVPARNKTRQTLDDGQGLL